MISFSSVLLSPGQRDILNFERWWHECGLTEIKIHFQRKTTY